MRKFMWVGPLNINSVTNQYCVPLMFFVLGYITNEMIQNLSKLFCYQGSISCCPITGLWCGILLFISRCRPSSFGLLMRAHEAWTEKPFARLLAAVGSHQKFQRCRIKSPSLNTHKCDLDQVKWTMWGHSHICSFGADQNVTRPSCSMQLML